MSDDITKELHQMTTDEKLNMLINLMMDTRQRLATVETQLRERLYDTRPLWEGVNVRFDAIDQRFDAVDQRFDAVDQRLDAIEQHLHQHDEQFTELRKAVKLLDVKVIQVHQDNLNLLAEVRTVAARVDYLEAA